MLCQTNNTVITESHKSLKHTKNNLSLSTREDTSNHDERIEFVNQQLGVFIKDNLHEAEVFAVDVVRLGDAVVVGV